MLTAVLARPVKPKNATITATIKNITIHPNIFFTSYFLRLQGFTLSLRTCHANKGRHAKPRKPLSFSPDVRSGLCKKQGRGRRVLQRALPGQGRSMSYGTLTGMRQPPASNRILWDFFRTDHEVFHTLDFVKRLTEAPALNILGGIIQAVCGSMSTPFRFRHVNFQLPSEPEMISLSRKYYVDSRSRGGRNRQNRDYLLVEKQLIECQTNLLHGVTSDFGW